MLVFVIPTSYPNPDNPVANSFVEEQVKALSQQKDCQIVVLNVQKQSTKKVFSKIDKNIYFVENDNSKIIRTKSKTFFERKLVILNLCVFTHIIKKLYQEAIHRYGKPDIIYAHFYAAGYAALYITAKQNIPVVVMEHSGDLMKSHLGFRETICLKYVVSHANKYIATTSKLKDMVLKHTNTNKVINIIPNIVDDIFCFEPIKRRDNFTYLAVSRLEYDKRVDLLISAFCKAFSKDEKVTLRIGGTGSELFQLRALVESEGRQEQIKFMGALSRNQVASEIKQSECFVLPSRHETFGLVWREALCVGRPVITTDHGGFSSKDWSDDFGIMIPVDDEFALINALRNMRDNFESYNLESISKNNQQMYSSRVIGDKIYDLFANEIKEL